METEGMFLSWVVVKDLKSAIAFYTHVIGLTLKDLNEEFGWAELAGQGGFLLGLAQENKECKAGSNAVVTVSVKDIVKACAHLRAKGETLVGDLLEIPGHVKMQTFTDRDGNTLQLVETCVEEKTLKPLSELARSLVPGSIYEHYKGKPYKLLSVGRHSETLEEYVVYQALYGEGGIWLRPLEMFVGEIEIEGKMQPRFVKKEG